MRSKGSATLQPRCLAAANTCTRRMGPRSQNFALFFPSPTLIFVLQAGIQTPPNFHEKPPEREKKNENEGGRKKKARNYGRSGGGRSGGGQSGRGGLKGRAWGLRVCEAPLGLRRHPSTFQPFTPPPHPAALCYPQRRGHGPFPLWSHREVCEDECVSTNTVLGFCHFSFFGVLCVFHFFLIFVMVFAIFFFVFSCL